MHIYLDNAATTKVLPEAAQAALIAMTQHFGNPSSGHFLGKQATLDLQSNREQVSKSLGCTSDEIFFTSGGTEADNWAISIMAALSKKQGKHIITTAIEHSAIRVPLENLEKQGYDVSFLPPDHSGHISPEQVEKALRPDTAFLSMMLVNNESGALLPVAQVAKLLKEKGHPALLHTDGVQAFLKVPFTPTELGVDLLSLSAHKIGGPKGAGALYIRKGIQASPFLVGGNQENGLRSGTESTPLIAAFATACRLGSAGFEKNYEYLHKLKAYALTKLQETLPSLVVVSSGDAPHICAISLPGYPSEMLVRDLSDRSICVSSGSACHKGKPSHVFAAMKLPPNVLMGVLRISFSPENTSADIDHLVAALDEITKTRIPAKR